MIRRLIRDGFPAAEPAPSGSRRSALFAAAGLALLVTYLYWPAIDFKLIVFDDPYYTRGDITAAGLDAGNIVRVFTTELPDADLFVPVTLLSFMADVELFGGSDRAFHFTNIVLFAVSMALLLILLWRMTGRLGRSAAAAAFVALHPLRVESVAWVSERKDVLSLVFLLVSLLCYVRYSRTGRWRWYGAVTVAAVLGTLAKPTLVALPFLLLVLDFWPLARIRTGTAGGARSISGARIARLAAEKVPFLAIAMLASLATVHFQAKTGLHEGVSLVSRLEHSFSSIFIYLYETAWPRDLAIRFFDTPWSQYSGALLPAAGGFLLLTAAAVRFSGARPYLAFGWIWYVASLFPVSGIVPSGAQWISDRFTLIPHVGLAVAIVWLGADLAPRRFRAALPAIVAALLLPLAILSRHQLFIWKDGAALFGSGLARNGEDPRYINQYVVELLNVGDVARAREQLGRIRRHLMDPWKGVETQLNWISVARGLDGRLAAIEAARGFLRADPRFWKTRMSLADDLRAEGRFAEAAAEYREVLGVRAISPSDRAYALEGLGFALFKMGKAEEALAAYHDGLRENPRRVSLRYRLARLLAVEGKSDEAFSHLARALEVNPGALNIRTGMAELLLESGEVNAASRLFEEVARDAPGKAESYYAKGRVLEAAGMKAEARSAYESALKAPPVVPETLDVVRERLAGTEAP